MALHAKWLSDKALHQEQSSRVRLRRESIDGDSVVYLFRNSTHKDGLHALVSKSYSSIESPLGFTTQRITFTPEIGACRHPAKFHGIV